MPAEFRVKNAGLLERAPFLEVGLAPAGQLGSMVLIPCCSMGGNPAAAYMTELLWRDRFEGCRHELCAGELWLPLDP